MKKIISALTLGAMVAGVAFADFAVSANYRQRAALLSHNFKNDNTDATSYTMYEDAYSGNGTDNITINMAGDIVSFDVTLVGDQAKTSNIRAKTLGGNLRVAKIDFFGGFWADGKLNGAYRNKADIDAGNLEGMDFEFKKLGSAYAGSPSFFVDNYVMPVNTADGGESYALGARYAIPGMKKLKATVTGSYITNAKSDETASTSSKQLQGHTGVLHVDTRSAFGNVEGVFKYGQAKNGDDAITSGDNIKMGTELTVTATPDSASFTVASKFSITAKKSPNIKIHADIVAMEARENILFLQIFFKPCPIV